MTTPTTPAEPTPGPTPVTVVNVTTVSEPVTETAAIQEVITSVSPTALNVTEIKVENVEVTKIGVAELTTTTQAPILANTIDTVLPTATESTAQQVLTEIKQSVSTGAASPIAVNVNVEVFEIKEKTTNKTAFVSKFTLAVEAKSDAKNVKIVEVIPKSLASNVVQVVFKGEQPEVLQADPIVQWIFPTMKEGELRYLSYELPKKVETVETKTIAVAEAVEAPAPAPTPAPEISSLYIIGLIVAAIVIFIIYKVFMKK